MQFFQHSFYHLPFCFLASFTKRQNDLKIGLSLTKFKESEYADYKYSW